LSVGNHSLRGASVIRVALTMKNFDRTQGGFAPEAAAAAAAAME